VEAALMEAGFRLFSFRVDLRGLEVSVPEGPQKPL
jgi:hypothetical protein